MKAGLLFFVVICLFAAVQSQKKFMVRRPNSPQSRPSKFTESCIKACHKQLMSCVAKSFNLWQHFHENKKKIRRELNRCCGTKFNRCSQGNCGAYTWGCKLSKQKWVVGEVPDNS